MKRIVVLLAFFMAATTFSMAQKIVYVDTDKVLNSMPEYQAAQKEIDKVTEKWQKEIQSKYAEIEAMYKAYQAEEILLTEDLKQRRQEEIIEKEKQLKDLQKAKFGHEGELFRKRQELVKPIQDEIYAAIQKMATQSAYDFVLDKSSGISILFANDKYNKTGEIMRSLGLSDK